MTEPTPAPAQAGAGTASPRRQSKRRKPRPAANSRWIATGLALCGTFGMVGGMAHAARSAQSETPQTASAVVAQAQAPSATTKALPPKGKAKADAKAATPDKVVVVRRYVPTEGAQAAAPPQVAAPAPVTSSGGS